MAKTHKEILQEALQDPDTLHEYEALEAEFQLRRALIQLRREMGLTQEEVAERLGTKQEYISRLERGHVDVTLSYLARLLSALDADLEVSFVPKSGGRSVKTRITTR